MDWVGGNDPQYRTFIPVSSDKDIETLKNASVFGLLKFFPRLQIDFPKERKTRLPPQWIR
jgi:hypothetical protein